LIELCLKRFICILIKGKMGKEGAAGDFGIKGGTGLLFFFYLIHIYLPHFFLILGPPGPPGNDGLPGGKLIMKKKMDITVLFEFFPCCRKWPKWISWSKRSTW
jgi:hypothetical protein